MTWHADDDLAPTIRERFVGWTNCNITHDMDALAGFLHDDFVYVSVFGELHDKASYIALASSLNDDAVYEVRRFDVRRSDEVPSLALVDGEYRIDAVTADGRDLSADTRFTAVWAVSDGCWTCLRHQGTLYEIGRHP